MVRATDQALVRIRDRGHQVVGAGFVVGSRQVLTCAHVVARALDEPANGGMPSRGAVSIDFPYKAAPLPESTSATVAAWSPLVAAGSELSGDLAILELPASESPISPVRFLISEDLTGRECRSCGFPIGYDGGIWAYAVVRDRLPNGWYQIEDSKIPGERIRQGFSGAPVVDARTDRLLGMIVAAATEDSKVAFMAPADLLRVFWPELLVELDGERAGWSDWDGGGGEAPASRLLDLAVDNPTVRG